VPWDAPVLSFAVAAEHGSAWYEPHDSESRSGDSNPYGITHAERGRRRVEVVGPAPDGRRAQWSSESRETTVDRQARGDGIAAARERLVEA
jgi:hypothetical protein